MSIELNFRVELSGSNTLNQQMIFNGSTDASSILMTFALYSKVSQANCHTKQLIMLFTLYGCVQFPDTQKNSAL